MTNLEQKTIFHEIKNQISVCDLYTEVIRRTLDKKGIEDEILTRAIKNIKISLSLIADCATNLKTPKIQEINLAELVKNTIEICRTYNTNVQFSTDISETTSILADKAKFTSALTNIIKNAIEANSTEISITWNCEKLIIANNGEEIPSTLKEKIFTDGFTTKENGTGLGLALVKKMLEEQNFTLMLENTNSNLTIFNIIAK